MMAFYPLQVSLLYANVSPDDILLKQKLDILATSHPNLKVKLFQNVNTLADLSKSLFLFFFFFFFRDEYGLYFL